MLRNTFVVLICLCIVSCALQRTDSHALPGLDAIDCCVLIQEKIELINAAGSHYFSAALAIEPGVHTLIVFDGLGGKILVSHRRPGSISIDMDKSDGRIPIKLLWSAINLVHAPVDSWLKTGQGWRAEGDKDMRILHHNSDLWARARVGQSVQGLSDADIDFPAQNITLKIHGVERRAL